MRTIVLTAAMLFAVSNASRADALKTAAVGCTAPADAEKIAATMRQSKAAADALARPLVASRACIDFTKGVKVDVDERRPPLTCIRLTGDLSCYWITAALLDEHPSEKGIGSKRSTGRRH